MDTNALFLNYFRSIIPSVEFYWASFPILILFLSSLAILIVASVAKSFDTNCMASRAIAFTTLIVAMLVALTSPWLLNTTMGCYQLFLKGSFIFSPLGSQAMALFCFLALGTLAAGSTDQKHHHYLKPEFLVLLLLCTAGLCLMVATGECMSFFIGLEMASISLYVLVGYGQRNLASMEAAIKYYLLGSCASATLLMGMALLYLHTGSLRWESMSHIVEGANNMPPLAILGTCFFVLGMAFKIGLAPFHSWVPDVYQGAPALLTAFMSSAVKCAMVFSLTQILPQILIRPSTVLANVFVILGVCSSLFGCFFGLVQRSVKRILAYSSVANGAFFALGLAALCLEPKNSSLSVALFHFVTVYALASFGSYFILSHFEQSPYETGPVDVFKQDLIGLGKQNPAMALCLSICLLSLAGIPPLAGFMGKYLILQGALSQGLFSASICFILLTLFSLYYYLHLLVNIWFIDTKKDVSLTSLSRGISPWTGGIAWLCASILILLGLYGPFFNLPNPLTAGNGGTQASVSP